MPLRVLHEAFHGKTVCAIVWRSIPRIHVLCVRYSVEYSKLEQLSLPCIKSLLHGVPVLLLVVQ